MGRHIFLLAMEGPDPYATVGGLQVRVWGMARAFARHGDQVTLTFVGDPAQPGRELRQGVQLWRWGQRISRHNPKGVYEGEEAKLRDLAESWPQRVLADGIEPALAQGDQVLVQAEDWQTVPALITLSGLLAQRGLLERVPLLYNSNQLYGADRIDWLALNRVARVFTVSRYMKMRLQKFGVDAVVVPNGLDPEAFLPGDPLLSAPLSQLAGKRPLLLKVARFDPQKSWIEAIRAVAMMKSEGFSPLFFIRGDSEPYGDEVLAEARRLGLRIGATASRDIDLVVHPQPILPAQLRALYRTADAVLAQSEIEPFGYVGLETMAQGGVAVVGETGEYYARHLDNAFVVNTGEPSEIVHHLKTAISRPDLVAEIRKGGEISAQRYAWAHILELWADRVSYVTGQR
ncbi:MAG: glycosyltransferase family 4 protein [Sulfobacillus sp.]